MQYRNSGFPHIIGFKDGERVYSEVISSYQDAFKNFVHTLQPSDTDLSVALTGPRKLAQNYIYEDTTPAYVYVVANSNERYCAELRERLTGREGATVKLERELTAADLQNHLIIEGTTADFEFDFLKGQETPIEFGDARIRIGDCRFAAEDVGLETAFPNPNNRESFVFMRLNTARSGRLLNNTGNDFTLWRYGDDDEPCDILIDGDFAKHPGNIWTFSDSLVVTHANLTSFCKGGVCPLPSSSFRKATVHECHPTVREWKNIPSGSLMVLGNGDCRLPSIAAGPDGEIAVGWEENGDIVMATMRAEAEPEVTIVESNSHDSFDPQIAWNGQSYFVAYLSDQDGWYRVYGCFVTGDRVSPQILVSEVSALDVVTPAVTADTEGHMFVAWAEWEANQRFPYFRPFEGRTAGPIQTLQHLSEGTNDYTNVWYFDLALDLDGDVFGAWNQHYPATLSVCAGDLTESAQCVTAIAANPDNNENGGYPSITFDRDGRPWTARQTCWWDAKEKPQQILAAYFDDKLQTWSTPYIINTGRDVWLNETPQIVNHGDGLTVVWSGRADHIDSTWGIYLSHFSGTKWSKPVMISPEGVCARAPQIAVASDGAIWVCWHSGVGDEMRTAVLRYEP